MADLKHTTKAELQKCIDELRESIGALEALKKHHDETISYQVSELRRLQNALNEERRRVQELSEKLNAQADVLRLKTIDHDELRKERNSLQEHNQRLLNELDRLKHALVYNGIAQGELAELALKEMNNLPF